MGSPPLLSPLGLTYTETASVNGKSTSYVLHLRMDSYLSVNRLAHETGF